MMIFKLKYNKKELPQLFKYSKFVVKKIAGKPKLVRNREGVIFVSTEIFGKLQLIDNGKDILDYEDFVIANLYNLLGAMEDVCKGKVGYVWYLDNPNALRFIPLGNKIKCDFYREKDGNHKVPDFFFVKSIILERSTFLSHVIAETTRFLTDLKKVIPKGFKDNNLKKCILNPIDRLKGKLRKGL